MNFLNINTQQTLATNIVYMWCDYSVIVINTISILHCKDIHTCTHTYPSHERKTVNKIIFTNTFSYFYFLCACVISSIPILKTGCACECACGVTMSPVTGQSVHVTKKACLGGLIS